MTVVGTSGAIVYLSSTCLAIARLSINLTTAITVSSRSKTFSSSSSIPDSILEKSRISLIMFNRESPQPLIVCTKSVCSSSRVVISKSCAMPNTPFIGVRISWLILAKKSLLALLASSAFCLASAKSSSDCLRISISTIRARLNFFSPKLILLMERYPQNLRPLRVIYATSKLKEPFRLIS